jgi:outer membrane usher protein FimD/PapC
VVLARPGESIGPPPAHFVVRSLLVNPVHITVGESSDVSVRVTNNGGMPGEYSVQVRVNGIVQKIQSVHLESGETQDVGLVFTPEQNGTYTVSVDFIALDLQVDPRQTAEASDNSFWWLIYLSLGLSILALSLFIFRKRKGDGEVMGNDENI